MKIGQQGIDHLEAVAGTDEQSCLATVRRQAPSAAAVSRLRTLVVPTATTPPTALPRPVHRLDGRLADLQPFASCILCRSRSCSRTGVKVPAPTCRVTRADSTPIPANRSSIAWSKCSPRGGRGDRARALRHRPSGSARGRRAYRHAGCRWQRHVAMLLHQLGKPPVRCEAGTGAPSDLPSAGSYRRYGCDCRASVTCSHACARPPGLAPPAARSAPRRDRRTPWSPTAAPQHPRIVEHQQVAGLSRLARSPNRRSAGSPRCGRCSNRPSPRRALGCCAIRRSGRS